MLRGAARQARRTVVFVVGAALCLAGIALIPLPGPGLLILALGLAVLATEFRWARRLLDRAKQRFAELRRRSR